MSSQEELGFIENARRARRRMGRRIIEALGDRLTRMETRRIVSKADLGLEQDANQYQALGWLNLLGLRKILKGIGVKSGDVFVDLGSGKGRVLYLAARSPFARVIGVEYSDALTQIARKNIDRNIGRLACKDVRTITADAAAYPFEDEITFAFLFNPFEGDTFERVIENIQRSLERKPRRFHIIYAHSLMREVLVRRGFVETNRLRNMVVFAQRERP